MLFGGWGKVWLAPPFSLLYLGIKCKLYHEVGVPLSLCLFVQDTTGISLSLLASHPLHGSVYSKVQVVTPHGIFLDQHRVLCNFLVYYRKFASMHASVRGNFVTSAHLHIHILGSIAELHALSHWVIYTWQTQALTRGPWIKGSVYREEGTLNWYCCLDWHRSMHDCWFS